MAAADSDVFINCPFDADYKLIFHTLVFTVIRCGFQARCALEADDASDNRLAKICSIIEACRYGVHDISRTEASGDPRLPRLNVPLELGLFLGAKRFGGGAQKGKRCMIFDREPHRYQRFISDIAGQDIHSHRGSEAGAIEQLAAWLRDLRRNPNVPGGRAIAAEYVGFKVELPIISEARSLHPSELTFNDLNELIAQYMTFAGRPTGSV